MVTWRLCGVTWRLCVGDVISDVMTVNPKIDPKWPQMGSIWSQNTFFVRFACFRMSMSIFAVPRAAGAGPGQISLLAKILYGTLFFSSLWTALAYTRSLPFDVQTLRLSFRYPQDGVAVLCLQGNRKKKHAWKQLWPWVDGIEGGSLT